MAGGGTWRHMRGACGGEVVSSAWMGPASVSVASLSVASLLQYPRQDDSREHAAAEIWEV